ncbi:glutathione S-transferase [Aestuariirhabdus litorea]|uniref:Glutathione S-transferase n=1 Tax=Aestuariirhabdus litorea TaxID=2528527 RepID=A0A3P3VM01_9GAMM|nr:glutathione S-transferase N-terminal domain-containing protein [Aestuariirhabdus litorea]RRJ83801.1 glutathione S-transferase [Aestuariirhabdus litorea]RWW97024.1 glutathione S-transferase [Endozoicomonadaceae bacterium GTF-13]
MKLYLNTTSPYARMVRIVLLETGLEERVELCWCDPWSDDAALLEANALGRIPTLVTDQGVALAESLLIALYLNDLAPAPLPMPAGREATLQLAGQGQGLMDAAFNSVIARKYQGEAADESELGQRRARAIERTLSRLESQIDRHSGANGLSLGDIVLAVALDYLAFRLPEQLDAERYPRLQAWRQGITHRPSFDSTAFG